MIGEDVEKRLEIPTKDRMQRKWNDERVKSVTVPWILEMLIKTEWRTIGVAIRQSTVRQKQMRHSASTVLYLKT